MAVGIQPEWGFYPPGSKEAVQLFKAFPFDVIIMDIQMPILNGFEATQQIRAWELEQERQPTPTIALTANAMKQNIEKTIASRLNRKEDNFHQLISKQFCI
ncbi:MAG: response regulator [Magnetococcales bacterium]|nr:response regulator [Magnetococcales bacterium]